MVTGTTADTLRVGAHVDQADPVAEALARGASLSQFFLGDPQGYRGPEVRYDGGAEALRAAAEEHGIDLYVHAPYIINVATTNNRIRIPSRKLLQQHMDAAASIGAKALIVHGGHVEKAGDDPELLEKGFDNWRKAVEATDIKVPLLIENTAGGNDLTTVVDDVRAITGEIALVHANDSRDAFDSGADRHTNFGAGRIDPDELAAVVRAAGAPVVCETPGGPEEHRADFDWLRQRV